MVACNAMLKSNETCYCEQKFTTLAPPLSYSAWSTVYNKNKKWSIGIENTLATTEIAYFHTIVIEGRWATEDPHAVY